MTKRSLRATILAGLLVASMAACPSAGSASGTEPVPAADETPVFQAVRDAVTKLETGLHHKVSSIVTDKTSGQPAGFSYESTWQVTVRYWLDYQRPDDVPYLKGMQRCLAEFKAAATKAWVDWAESQVSQRRSQYADQIAFQQEAKLQAKATASVDQSGKIVLSTLKVFHLFSPSETISFDAETLALPTDKQSEQAGYDFLKAKMDGQSSTSGGAQPPQQSGTQSPSSAQPNSGEQPAGTSQLGSGRNSSRPNQRVLTTGIAALVGLFLLLAWNQYLRNRRL